MNRALIKGIWAILSLLIFASCEKNDLSDNTSFLVYPKGNETLVGGKVYEITWNSNDAAKVNIGLYDGTELIYQIAQTTENDGFFEGAISDDVPVKEDLNLKITSIEHEILIESKSELRILPAPQFSSFVDERDGTVYKTVKIGEQWWMAENFRFLTETGYYEYDSEVRYEIYGILYSYDVAVMYPPEGWHLPTDEEWNELERYLGLTEEEIYIDGNRGTYVGDLLKYESGLGFDALYGGYRNSVHEYNSSLNGHEGWEAHFWTSSSNEVGNIVRILTKDNGGITRRYTRSHAGCSVRYIKNTE